MIDVESHRAEDMPVAAGAVWDVIADFGSLGDWWPAGLLEGVDVEGDGIGMVRHIRTVIGLTLSERLDALDPEARQLRLSITGDLPANMAGYHATGQVFETGADSSRLEWTGRYQVEREEDAAGARAFLEGAYATMFRGIREHLGAGE